MVTMVDSAVFLLILTGLVIQTRGQQVPSVEVTVGVQGSFYVPATISASMNDIIQFVFGGDFHDVTQSSFEEPCTPLPGGFSSGLAGRGSNFSLPTPLWNLQITNVSGPLWFFCGASIPTSHCATGMVGVINPPSQEMYSSFVQAARSTSPTATLSSLSYIPNGVGAFATSPPTPTAVPMNVTSAPPPTTTPTPSSTPSPTSTGEAASSANSSQSTTSRLGAIIGGSIGGAVALGGFIIIILVLRRTGNRKSRRRSEVVPYTTERVWDGYDPGAGTGNPASPPLSGMSERSKMSGGDAYGTQALGYYGQDSNRGELTNRYNTDRLTSANVPRSQASTGTLQPNRNLFEDAIVPPSQLQPQSQILQHPYAMTKPVDQDHDEDVDSRFTGGDVVEPVAGDATIHALAKQVAKVLMHGALPIAPGSDTQTLAESDGSEVTKARRLPPVGINHQNTTEGLESISRETHSTAPPLYRSYDER